MVRRDADGGTGLHRVTTEGLKNTMTWTSCSCSLEAAPTVRTDCSLRDPAMRLLLPEHVQVATAAKLGEEAGQEGLKGWSQTSRQVTVWQS